MYIICIYIYIHMYVYWVAESAGTKVCGDTGGIAGDKVGTPHLQQVGLLRRTCFCLVCRDATLAMTNSC